MGWGRVRLVVCGPSSVLLTQDSELQEELEDVKAAGVELLACKACADLYGVTDKLTELGIDIIYMGAPLTEMLKTGWTCLTFKAGFRFSVKKDYHVGKLRNWWMARICSVKDSGLTCTACALTLWSKAGTQVESAVLWP